MKEELQQELERLTRMLIDLKHEKSTTVKGFNESIKDIDLKIKETILKLNSVGEAA